MRNQNIKLIVALSAVFATVVGVIGCKSSSSRPQPTTSDSSPVTRMSTAPEKKAGSELWAENCTRCHNARPPQYYSDAQWDIIVHHMRMRADLTGQEARAIAEFLKAAN